MVINGFQAARMLIYKRSVPFYARVALPPKNEVAHVRLAWAAEVRWFAHRSVRRSGAARMPRSE